MVIGVFAMFGKRISLLALMILLSPIAQSEVYKWTDENGKVHFGDRPPVEQEAEQVAVPTGPTGPTTEEGEAASAAEASVSRQEATQRLLEQYETERDAKKQAAAKKREEQAKRKANCAQAKDNLRNYQEHARLYVLDENGERRYYTSEEREKSLARAKADVKRWCN
jgi:type IV secretory pathway VirB10-like protein